MNTRTQALIDAFLKASSKKAPLTPEKRGVIEKIKSRNIAQVTPEINLKNPNPYSKAPTKYII